MFVIHQNIQYFIRCYLFECWKSNELKVVLKLGNLRSQTYQHESLLLREGVKNKINGNFRSPGRVGGFDDVLILDLLLGELRLALKELHILPVGLVVRLDHVYISYSASASTSRLLVFIKIRLALSSLELLFT